MNSELALRACPETKAPAKTAEQWLEPAAALACTAFVAVLLVVVTLKAGPLWRDETNSINLAQMPSLKDLWSNLRFDSCPLLWPLVLRGWSFLGLAGTDLGIRALGLVIGLLFLACLWLCAWWMGGRGPVISLALLGSLPMAINIVGANRAYGLALCLLLLSFGALWRVVECPSTARLTVAALVAVLFVHCVYYDVIFLYGMLFGAAVVVVRRKQWRTLAALAAIGAGTGLSLALYLPVIAQSPRSGFSQVPFDFWTLWTKLSLAVTAHGSAWTPTSPGPDVWTWVILVLVGLGVTAGLQGRWTRQADGFHWSPAEPGCARPGADLALFGSISMLCGTVGYGCFLLSLQLPTEAWYYVAALTLCAISLEATLATPLRAVRPWGVMRVGFLLLIMVWRGGSVLEEALTRRTNIDLIAGRLCEEAREGDLVLVYGPWEGITFDRYYHGAAQWLTVPPIGSHKLHRSDLVIEKLSENQPLGPALAAIDNAFATGHDVWVVGHMQRATRVLPLPYSPNQPPKWGLGDYFNNWSAQVMAHLLARSHPVTTSALPLDRPVNHLEDLPLMRFVQHPSRSE